MPKHVREALRLAGIPRGQVQIEQHGHIRITYGGKTITCSSSPRDRSTAAWRIAKDLGKSGGGAA